MTENLTFEQLPKAVSQLNEKLDSLKTLLLKKQEPQEKPDELLTIKQAAKFLTLSVATLYSKVSKNEIPYMKKSKRLYFSRTELLDYLKNGKHKSNAEIEAAAQDYLNGKA